MLGRLCFLCVSNIIGLSVTQHELALERERWVERNMEVIHHVAG